MTRVSVESSPRWTHRLALIAGIGLLLRHSGFTPFPAVAWNQWRGLPVPPQAEPVLNAKLPYGYQLHDRVPLAHVMAFEVRRMRHFQCRGSNNSVVPLFEDTRNRRRKLRQRFPQQTRDPLPRRGRKDSSGPWWVRWRMLPGRQKWLSQSTRWRIDSIPGDSAVRAVPRESLRSPTVNRVIVNEDLRILFCPIPYVASKTWIAFLRRLAGHRDWADLRRGVEGLRLLSDYSDRDKERLLHREDFIRIIFVRNPFNRILSLYYNATHDADLNSHEYRNFMSLVRGRKLSEKEREVQIISFSFFLKDIGSVKRQELPPLFAPQVDVCGAEFIDYQFVGRYESFGRDVQRLLSKLGIPLSLFPTPGELGLALTNKSRYHSLLDASPKHRPRIVKIYNEDFVAWKYSMNEE